MLDRILATLPGKSAEERRKMRANAERMLARGTEIQREEAQHLISALDAPAAAEREAEVVRLGHAPVAERVAEAFRLMPPTGTEETVIRALLDDPGSTSTQLSRACGWEGQAWHAHFGKMCHARELYLWPAERSGARDASFYSGILAEFAAESGRFTMRAEAAGAFARLGIVARRVASAAR